MQKTDRLATERVLKKLEFDKIRVLLLNECSSESGKAFAERIQPLANPKKVRQYQAETSEAVQIRHNTLDVPLGGIVNVKEALQKLKIGGYLGAGDFLNLARLLYATRRMKQFLSDPNRRFTLDVLAPYSDRLEPVEAVEKEINRVFKEDGEIADKASEKLYSIRKRIAQQKQLVRQRMEDLLRANSMQDHLQDNLITVRGNRFVIPVKAEHRQRVPGIIHDQSASGATLYIEPMSVVDRNNEIQKLEMDEEAEIQRIIEALSDTCRPYAGTMLTNWRTLVYLDFTFAKARLSDKMNGYSPDAIEGASLKLYRARHPLIDPAVVVPIDVSLGIEADCLVITGPNTGGKTVTLKTVGLLILMHQSGLHIPVAIGSEMGYFKAVYADIGDEQSIEQSLSTFSSHMTNITGILKEATEDSLILYDELGAGTDPTEGAALAVAILEASMATGSKIIATTHYGELKNFAFQTPRVQNASVEFDITSLKPTYKLLMGITGNSNAFDISARIGLPPAIITRAKRVVEEARSESERLLSDLETAQYAVTRQQEVVKHHLAELEAREKTLADREKSLEKSAENVLDNAKEKAANILLEAKRAADDVTKELKTLQKTGQLEAAQQAGAISKNLSDSAYKMRSTKRNPRTQNTKPLRTVKVGEEVHLNQFGQAATVLTEPDKSGNFQVQAGIMKMTVNLKDVTRRNQTNKPSGLRKKSSGKAVTAISTELDLRGLTGDEALPILDKYLDDAFLNAVPQARIIHGKGTGALRKWVQQELKHNPHVSAYRLGNFDEGGDGVTVVTIK